MRIPQRAPLYFQVLESIKAEIRKSFHTGDRLPGEQEMAGQLGVSTLTVREAFTALSHEGWIERRAAKGTFVSPPGRSGRIHIGCLVDADISATSCFTYGVLRMHQILRELLPREQYRVTLYTGNAKLDKVPEAVGCPEFLEDLHERKLAGVLMAFGYREPSLLRFMELNRIPLFIWGRPSGYGLNIRSDLREMLKGLAEHFVKSGRCRIAFIGWEGFWDSGINLQERVQAFSETVTEAGGEVRDEWIKMGLAPTWSGAGWEQFRAVWSAYREKPDAVIFGDYRLYENACMAVHELALKVPEQLAFGLLRSSSDSFRSPYPCEVVELDVETVARTFASQIKKAFNENIIPHGETLISQVKHTYEGNPRAQLEMAVNLFDNQPEQEIEINE